MKIEIWSDVMCPFCYLGKRRLESALARFPHRDEVEIAWKSFQLNPDMETVPGKSINAYLAEKKGWSPEQTRQVHERLTKAAAEAGLLYDFDKAVVANSFDAHRLVQLAKRHGLGDAMEERLFKAYFSEGRNIADHGTLLALAADAGLDRAGAAAVLAGDAYTDEVNADVREARQLGVTGVPFFVLDRKFAVSGAQDTDVFLQALETAYRKEQAQGQAD
jgi:predicted DsbA family dithiol-disulfide isomerase